jgi:hemin uptake protein HemP
MREPGGATTEMATTSGDGVGGAGKASNPSAATRSIAINGNRIDSRELFASEREIIISHGEDAYRLRLTSQNKLILTK